MICHINRATICNNNLSDVIPNMENIIFESKTKKELMAEIEMLKRELALARSKIATYPENNQVSNIKVNSFESTDLEYLNDGVYKYCIDRMIMSVPSFIEKVHFNPKHPENHNVCITNIKDTYVTTFDGTKWILHDRDTFLEDIEDKYEYKLNSWVRHNAEEHSHEMRQFQLYLEKSEKHGVRDKIKNKIKFILYNNRSLVKNRS